MEAEKIFIETMKRISFVHDKEKMQKKYDRAILTLDLHGKSVKESTVLLESYIKRLEDKSVKKIIVITGKGNHSFTVKPVLFDAVDEFLSLQCKKLSINYVKKSGVFEIWKS